MAWKTKVLTRVWPYGDVRVDLSANDAWMEARDVNVRVLGSIVVDHLQRRSLRGRVAPYSWHFRERSPVTDRRCRVQELCARGGQWGKRIQGVESAHGVDLESAPEFSLWVANYRALFRKHTSVTDEYVNVAADLFHNRTQSCIDRSEVGDVACLHDDLSRGVSFSDRLPCSVETVDPAPDNGN